MQAILRSFKQIFTLLLILLVCAGCNFLPATSFNPWELVMLPTESAPLDLAFVNPQHGWLVGNHAALLETLDGGRTWQSRSLALGEQDYRLTSVSFAGEEGWVIGQPAILLHTTDAGQTWSRVSLSEQLPGDPNTIFALGPQSAEMTTNVGAIYRTEDGGKTWQALVQEAFGILRNISRSEDGKYVAVSSRGNFYSTWEPGQTSWEPHNRNTSRRIQNMGFGQKDQLWMLSRGGQIQFSQLDQPEEWSEPLNPQFAVSIGLLDLAYRTPKEIWVAGGSGNLLCSFDGGQTWEKDTDLEDVPSNFYRILFLNPEQGFILGQKGTLLRYVPEAKSAAALGINAWS